jgi:hypothetical protein
VKSGNGFVSVDYERSRAEPVSGFITRKDLGWVDKNAVGSPLLVRGASSASSAC